MKRRAQGKTRTGATPFCMAEVSPRRATAKRLGVFFDVARSHYDQMLYASNSGLCPPYYDTVAFFTASHPPAPAFDQLCEYDIRGDA